MDVSPQHGSSKPARAKGAAKANHPKPARKTLTAARPKKPASPAGIVAATSGAPLDLNDMIAITAFYLSAERGFAPGRELDDWLEAERRVRAQLPVA